MSCEACFRWTYRLHVWTGIALVQDSLRKAWSAAVLFAAAMAWQLILQLLDGASQNTRALFVSCVAASRTFLSKGSHLLEGMHHPHRQQHHLQRNSFLTSKRTVPASPSKRPNLPWATALCADRNVSTVKTPTMQAKKVCQPKACENPFVASSSIANSRPPIGAPKAVAMPTAVPAQLCMHFLWSPVAAD